MPNHSADVGKLVEELIQKHQAEADDLALSEKVKYGDSSTVSTYTWVHSMKAMSQKFVRDLLDIQTVLDNVPTISPDDVRGVGEWIMLENQSKEDTDNGNYWYTCSHCSAGDLHAKVQEVPFCWKCGARMKGADGSK